MAINLFELINPQIILAILVGCIAVIWDLRYRKIPNWLTLPAVIIGFVLFTIYNPSRWYFSLLGILLGLLVFLFPYLLGGIGAGDVKLLMALGAIFGPVLLVWIMLFTGVAGGVISIIQMLKNFGFKETRQKLSLFLLGITNGSTYKLSNQNDQKKDYIPYGLAIFIGLITVIIFKYQSI